MSPDLQTLRAIHDGLGNPWWPLAPGWWLLALLLVAAVALFRRYGFHRPVLLPIPLIHVGDWRWDARRELRRLRRRRPGATPKMQIAGLAELLKRIAMALYGRSACAGLHGQAWLDWLSAKDPKGFDWSREAQILIRAPYAPDPIPGCGAAAEGVQTDTQAQLERLIRATEHWLRVRPGKALPGKDSAGRLQTAAKEWPGAQPGGQTDGQTDGQTGGAQPRERSMPRQALRSVGADRIGGGADERL